MTHAPARGATPAGRRKNAKAKPPHCCPTAGCLSSVGGWVPASSRRRPSSFSRPQDGSCTARWATAPPLMPNSPRVTRTPRLAGPFTAGTKWVLTARLPVRPVGRARRTGSSIEDSREEHRRGEVAARPVVPHVARSGINARVAPLAKPRRQASKERPHAPLANRPAVVAAREPIEPSTLNSVLAADFTRYADGLGTICSGTTSGTDSGPWVLRAPAARRAVADRSWTGSPSPGHA
jgi:hypothetical protein